MEQEKLDNLITHGRANATHWCLRHNPAGVNGESDKACIHRKKARFTIARVMVKSKCWKMCASTTMVSLKFPLQDQLQAVATVATTTQP